MSTISAAAGGAARLPRERWSPTIKLPSGYPLGPVLAFLVLVACLLALRSELPDGSFSELHWVLVVAAIPLLPWLFPLMARHVSNVRAGPVELALRDLDPGQLGPGVQEIEDVVEGLTEVSIADMPTRSRDILERVKEIEAERTEVVVVDLASAHWRLGTLYFFAFLLESRTIVRRLAFEERGAGKRRFLGMCSPRALRRAIEREHPLYRDVRKTTPLVDLESSGQAFFRALVAQSGGLAGEPGLSPPVDARGLKQLLGPSFEPERLERKELEGLAGLRRLLDSERRYVAVVEDGLSYQVLDRLRVALAVARLVTHA